MSIELPDIARLTAGSSEPLYLATVVATDGPCYRKVGARLLASDRGRLAGAVSGGCVERALVRKLEWLTRDGPRIETYDTAADGDETDASYLGCGGTIQVLVQRVDAAVTRSLARAAHRDGAACLATVIASGAPAAPIGATWAWTSDPASTDAPAWATSCAPFFEQALRDECHLVRACASGQASVLIEYLPPPRRLLVAARHYDAGPVMRFARGAGWNVTLATGTGSDAALEDAAGPASARIELSARAVADWVTRNPAGAVLLMTHSVVLDRECLAASLRAGPPRHLAVLGPASRTRGLLDAIAASGELDAAAAEQVRAPAGLSLGGEGAAAIALAVVAELEQVFARRIPVR